MTATASVVGINRTQDASISVIRGPSAPYCLQKERITRRKHHWGRLGDVRDLYLTRVPHLDQPVDLVVECYSSDSEIRNKLAYHDELREVLTFREEPRILQVSHHLAHAYSAFYPSAFSHAAALVIDCQGSPVKAFTDGGDDFEAVDPALLEAASFYTCAG